MQTSERPPGRAGPLTWVLRLAWLVLPVALGTSLADVLDDFDAVERVVAEAMLWMSWALGVAATLAPRTWGLTVMRVLALAAFGLASVAAAAEPSGAAVGALALAALAWTSVSTAEVTTDFVNGTAYGDERRIPLRHPRVVSLVLAPVSALLVATGVAAGPLLLADGRLVAGIAALLAGFAVSVLLSRSLHALSGRWLVFVPGGVVVHDPLALADAVLFTRDRLRRLAPMPAAPGAEVVDLRLGARGGEILIELSDPAMLPLARRGRIEATSASLVVVSLARPGSALAEARRRGLPLG